MNTYRVLEPTLKDILNGVQPLREDWVMRFKIIEELEDVVRSVESLRGATVEPFGSFVSNLFTRWGDLDISIVLSNGSFISSAGKKRKQNLLGDVQRALRQRSGWNRLQFIPNARVPILKFENASISCDVSIDNMQGLMKSRFLFWINEIDRRFRDMVLLVKEWAKTHNINNPKTGSLNSYSLSLLVIFHFQTCVPAILPPLKEIYPRNVIDDLTGVRTDAERHITEICAANISSYRSNKSRAINRNTLSELFISFLAKFYDIDSKATEVGICPFTGKWEEIRSNTRWLPRTYALFIEDPFEQPENTARAVSAGNMIRISEAIQTTYHRLVMANQNQISLLDVLVRPRISRSIATPVGNSSYTAGHNFRTPVGTSSYMAGQHITTHSQISRSVYSPSQAQFQTHNTRQASHPNISSVQRMASRPSSSTNRRQENQINNSTSPRYVPRSYIQGRPGWRPKSDQ
ncbi:POLY A polymerase CID PAP -RELATED [Salix viminalis]|uniref:POLY A polymerase CID PAP -RELATED n=2 Tax=Salix TaxID=40685 RepID=A0A9Q0TZ95_SALVM|nr:POLY A polymerase CID PAP -RELATED [Salix viminalis]